MRTKAIIESLPGGVEKPKIYTGLLVGNYGTSHSPQHVTCSCSPATQPRAVICERSLGSYGSPAKRPVPLPRNTYRRGTGLFLYCKQGGGCVTILGLWGELSLYRVSLHRVSVSTLGGDTYTVRCCLNTGGTPIQREGSAPITGLCTSGGSPQGGGDLPLYRCAILAGAVPKPQE